MKNSTQKHTAALETLDEDTNSRAPWQNSVRDNSTVLSSVSEKPIIPVKPKRRKVDYTTGGRLVKLKDIAYTKSTRLTKEALSKVGEDNTKYGYQREFDNLDDEPDLDQ